MSVGGFDYAMMCRLSDMLSVTSCVMLIRWVIISEWSPHFDREWEEIYILVVLILDRFTTVSKWRWDMKIRDQGKSSFIVNYILHFYPDRHEAFYPTVSVDLAWNVLFLGLVIIAGSGETSATASRQNKSPAMYVKSLNMGHSPILCFPDIYSNKSSGMCYSPQRVYKVHKCTSGLPSLLLYNS